MKDYICALDMHGTTDSQKIQNAIIKAKEDGTNKVLIPKKDSPWVITETISLPDDIEILADGAHLVLGDGTFINMFATENYLEKNTNTPQKNIEIHGINNAVFDGGKYNGLSEFTSRKNGFPHISVNTMMIFYNTENLYVHDIKIINQRWWAITNMFVWNSSFKNIDFKADLSRIDENGVHYENELPKKYEEIYVKNADGIDLRVGCHDITIENITGFTEDDTVALTAICGEGSLEYPFIPAGRSTDIHSVSIKNICADGFICSVVRLLCGNDHKIHDISIENVTDARTNPHYMAKATVRLGDILYGKSLCQKGDMYNISIKNVDSKARIGVSVCRAICDSTIENVKAADGGVPFAALYEAELYNVRVKNIELNTKTIDL